MKKKFSGPQIVAKLRQADIIIGQAHMKGTFPKNYNTSEFFKEPPFPEAEKHRQDQD
jgi:hypothetical protein